MLIKPYGTLGNYYSKYSGYCVSNDPWKYQRIIKFTNGKAKRNIHKPRKGYKKTK